MRRRRWGIAGVCAGVVLIAGSVVFRTVAVPALVRFPLNVDETATYSGTAYTYVDQATLLPLPVPRSEPLSLRRHVKVVDGDHDVAVVDRIGRDDGRVDREHGGVPIRDGPAGHDAGR